MTLAMSTVSVLEGSATSLNLPIIENAGMEQPDENIQDSFLYAVGTCQ